MQGLQDLRRRLFSGDVNATEVAAILTQLVSSLIEMKVLASRDLSMV